MNYKVISTLQLINTDAEDSEFNFQSEKDAKDYYRNAFTTMAETIVDFGGDFVITLVDLNESELLMRHTISTTINED